MLVEAALTRFRGNISVVGLTPAEHIAVDIYVEDGAVTHCTGYLGENEIEGDDCARIVMGIECVNCGAELTKLPPNKVIRRYRRPIMAQPLKISGAIDEKSVLLGKKLSPAEIALKGRMMLVVRASIADGLRALAALSTIHTAAMLATLEDEKLLVISDRGLARAAYLRLSGSEYFGVDAINKAMQEIPGTVLVQIFSIPNEIAAPFVEKID